METKLVVNSIVKLAGSYPTYEEWKHTGTPETPAWTVVVLILPMRNGNLILLSLE